MTTRDFTANVISASKVVPDSNLQTGKASGVWDLNEVLDLVKGGNWPTFGNVVTNSDDVFSTFLYDGTGSSQTITNNIDLTEGGLVWIKARSSSSFSGGDHWLIDTERGGTKYLNSNDTGAESGNQNYISAFNNNSFTLGTSDAEINFGSGSSRYVSWTFRKAPKFFDMVEFSTGGSAVEQTINHSLGSTPGMIIIKCTTDIGSWFVWHRGIGTTQYLRLEATDAVATYDGVINNVTSTSFTTDVGTALPINSTNIAYIFAHNDGDAEFGPTQDQDIIKCGSYTGDGGAGTTEVNLGFEPQWIFVKASSAADSWYLIDNVRGWVTHPNQANDAYLYANATNAEATGGVLDITSTGFKTTLYTNANVNGRTYIYMAIRRGGMQTPTAASSVFAIDTVQSSSGTGPAFISGFTTDHMIAKDPSATTAWISNSRLTGTKYMQTSTTDAEANSGGMLWDFNNGVWEAGSGSTRTAYMWARARGYLDVVCYTGTGSTRTINHNLSALPEMIWWKERSNTDYWIVYHKDLTSGSYPSGKSYLFLNDTSAVSTAYQPLTSAPTSSVLSLSASSGSNGSGETYIAYLFATAAGVSKVGSFTQSGATNVACGFSGDTPSLIILKRSDSAGDWYLFDYARGIVSGNDPHNFLNKTDAQVTNADIVDPYSGGFATTSSLTDGDYIFYAIAAVS